MASFYPPLVKGAKFNKKFFEFQNDPVSYSQFRSEAQLNIAGVDSVINVKEINNAGVQIQNEDLVITSNIIGSANTVVTAGTSMIPNFTTQNENLVIQSARGRHIFLGYNDGDGHIYVNTDTSSNMYVDGGDLIMNNGSKQKLRMGTSDLYFNDNNKWNATELKVSKVNLKGVDVENKLGSIDASLNSVVATASANKAELQNTINTVNSTLSQQVTSNKALADASFLAVNNELNNVNNTLSNSISTVNTNLSQQIATNKGLADATFNQVISTAVADKTQLQSSIASVNSSLSQIIATNKATSDASFNQVISKASSDKTELQNSLNNLNTSLASQITANKLASDASFGEVISTAVANKVDLQNSISALNSSLSQVIANNKTYTDASFSSLQTSLSNINSQLNSKIDTNKSAVDASLNSLSLQKADVTYVDGKVANLVNGAPEMLNSLSELASAIANDNNFSTSMVSLIGTKADKTYTDGQLSTLQSDINTRATATDLSSNITNLQSQINSKTSISQFTSTTSDLQSQINAKASTSYLDTQLAMKANQSDVTSSVTNLQTQVDGKAGTTYVNTQLATKANQSDFASTTSSLQTQINAKADASTITSQLALKANQADLTSTTSSLQTQLDSKASTTYVNNQLATKANQSDLTSTVSNLQSQLDTKATASFVNLQLDTLSNAKADKTYVDTSISNLVGTAPQTLNTLGEIAAAIAQDANFSVTMVSELATKTSKTYVDGEIASLQTQINNRALTSYLNQQLALKGDTTYINEQLALKSNVTDVATSLASKANAADLTALATTVASKADSSALTSLATTVSGKSDTSFVNSEIASAKAYADNAVTTATTGLATMIYVNNTTQMVKDEILGGASTAYDTLLELQTALTNNGDAVTALTNQVATKASTTYVDNAVSNLSANVQADLDAKASISYVNAQIANIPAPPSLTGYATETYVNTAIQNVQMTNNGGDLSSYATKTYVDTAITDLSANLSAANYASKTYVDNAVVNVSVDLTGYATQTYVTSAVSAAKNEILGGAGPAYDTLQELNDLIQSGDSSVSTALSSQIATKANDNAVVHLTGTETIGGIKIFSNNVTVPSLNNISATTIGYLDATSSIQTQLNSKASSSSVVDLSSTQTIGGVKTFSSDVTVPSLNNISSTTLGYLSGVTSSIQTQLNAKANDNAVVHLTGTETIGGLKTFSSNLTVPSINNITATTLGYLDATSSIQTQLNSKANSTAVVDLSSTQTITGNKTWNNINSFHRAVEQMQTLTITSNATTLDYGANSAIGYCVPPAATNFTLSVTNVPLTSYSGGSFTITLLINTATNKAYANALNINGTAQTIRYAGGSAAITISSAIWVIQTFTVLVLPATTTVGGVLSSVTQWY